MLKFEQIVEVHMERQYIAACSYTNMFFCHALKHNRAFNSQWLSVV